MPDQAIIDALLEERRGYVLRGLTARVAAVDGALAAEGYTQPDSDESRPARQGRR